MYSADLVSDSRGFLGLEAEWNDAVERAAVPHPFLRHEWIRTWWDAFGDARTQRLHIVVVRHAGRIHAIAPLMRERTSMYGMPVQRLRLLHNDHTPRADFIVPEPGDGAYRAVWDALDSDRGWDVLQLGQLPTESRSHGALRRMAAGDGRRAGAWQGEASPYLPIEASWTGAADAMSAKLRQNVRNRMKRLSQFGTPAFEMLTEPRAIRDAHADAERLEASGWKADAGTSIGSEPAARRFYAALAERAAECPWLRLLFLSAGGQRVAAAYAAEYANRLFFIKTGYDPAFAGCSPFKVLTFLTLQHAVEQGLSELDFLGGSEPWKLEWTASVRPHEWLFVFAGIPRGRLLHPLKFQIVPAIRQLCTFQPSRA